MILNYFLLEGQALRVGVFNPDIGSVSIRFFSVFGISVSKI